MAASLPETITITNEDIEAARRSLLATCPVARALRRIFPEALVGTGCFYLAPPYSLYLLSNELREFIKRFDAWSVNASHTEAPVAGTYQLLWG